MIVFGLVAFLIGLMLVCAGVVHGTPIDYPFKLSNTSVTGDPDQVWLDPLQFSVSITNFLAGGRRAYIEFIGSSTGGGTQTVLIAEPGVLLTGLGGNTNGIGADFSIVLSNQMTGVQLNGGPVVSTGDTTDFYPLASNPAGYLTAASANTNAVTNATSTATALLSVSLNTGILTLSPFTGILTNQQRSVQLNGGPVVSTGDTTDFYPFASNPAGYLTAVGGFTNGNVVAPGYMISITPGSANTSTVSAISATVNSQSNNTYATGTTQTPYNQVIAGNGTASNNFTVVQGLTSQGSFNAQNGGTIAHGLTVSGNFTNYGGNAGFAGSVGIATNLAVGGNLSIGGSLTSGNLAGGTGYLASNLSGQIQTSQLARVSNNSGTIGGAGAYLVVTFDPNTGLPIAWTTAAGIPAGSSTNAVTYLRDAQRGIDYNNVNGIIFTNVPYFTQNQSTNTIGFSNVVFDTVQILQGGTNFVLHGAVLSFTNANAQGGTLSLNASGTLAFGGSISNLSPASGLPTSLSYSHTALDSGSGAGTLTMNSSGGDFKFLGTTNNQLQALVFNGWPLSQARYWKYDTTLAWFLDEISFKDSSSTVQGWMMNLTGYSVPGFVFSLRNAYDEICLGQPNPGVWGGGYGYVGTGSRLIIDQLNSTEGDHSWYWGNNSNFTELAVSAAQAGPSSATSAVQNSDWVTIGATRSSATGLKAGYIGTASNADFLAVWSSYGMATNPSTYVYQSTNTLDATQYGTNRFGGFFFGHNGAFGSQYSNVVGMLFRDDTNGLWCASVDTNGNLWVGPTNNIRATLVAPLLSGGGSATTFQDTNIVVSPDANGLAVFYSSALTNVSGALVTPFDNPALDSAFGGTAPIIANVISHLSNSVTVGFMAWSLNDSAMDPVNNGPGVILTNSVHFFR
jgi:hypothetical protein